MTFPDTQVFCVMDYETYSEADLKAVGAFEYSMHPSTEVLCLAFRIGTKKSLQFTNTHGWAPEHTNSSITGLLNAFEDPSIILVAHNALFEQVITRNVLARMLHTQARYLKNIPPERWVCTASLASALALPRNLEGAGAALKLKVQKNMDGHRLMLKWAQPKKPTMLDPLSRHVDPGEFEQLINYCKQDVDTEVELFLRVPMLTAKERKVWCLDQAINLRGFQVDRPLVKTVLSMIAEETKELDRETFQITQGAIVSTNQRARVLDWFESKGYYLANLQMGTVVEALKEKWGGAPQRLLEIRQAMAKTSTAKYIAFEQRSRHDSRLRDILVYHTASTGRWGGTGVQPQNFPRGTVKNTTLAAEVLAGGDLEEIRMLYKDPMNVFSSCLRSMIVAPPGKTLDVADYAAIEARVLFWVARHEAGLEAFREGRDLYKEMARDVYRVSLEKVDYAKRWLGKTLVLGAGFGLGWKRFLAHCQKEGQAITDDLAQEAIKAYRTTHKPVTILWKNLERAAIVAVENPGKKFTINRTSWHVRNGFLWCGLPSGRRLAYPSPTVIYETIFGVNRPVLYYWGVDALTKKWSRQKSWGGVLTENVVQAIARDIMAEAMLRIDATDTWQIVLCVHDELIAERDTRDGDINLFCGLMEELPDWADGLPVKVEGWGSTRYKKG